MSEEQKPSFDTIFVRYKQRIFEMAYRVINNPVDAEDITQEVFLRAYRAYGGFRQESEIYSWLYRIALNLCREKIRKIVRTRKYVISMLSLDQPVRDEEGNERSREIPDGAPLPLPSLESEEVRDIVRKAIESLPAKYSEILMLRDIGDLPYEEIAGIAQISVDAVGVRLIRARSLLREKLKDIL